MSLLSIVHAGLWTASVGMLIAACITDLRHRIIPNRLVLSLSAAAILLILLVRPATLWLSLAIAFASFCALWVLVMRDLLGGGDAKLIAAVTLLVAPDRIGALLAAIALAGGLLSLSYLAGYHLLRRLPPIPLQAAGARHRLRFLQDERGRIASREPVPYALAIAGGLFALVISEVA